MPTATYTPLAEITLGSAAASVSFSSISQSYRDVILVLTGTTPTTAQNCVLRINGDTTATGNYPTIRMRGDGSTASSTTFNLAYIIGPNLSTSVPSPVIWQVMDYSATDKHKTVLGRGGGSDVETTAIAGRWANTAAITSLTVLVNGSQNFTSGSTFALYGIAS